MKIAFVTGLLAGPLVVLAQLNALAKDAGLLYFGTAVSPGDSNDAAYYRLENDIKNFGQYTPDNAQKWDAIQPSRGRFSYGAADAIVNRALSNRCSCAVTHWCGIANCLDGVCFFPIPLSSAEC